ncbi:hypothetical protein BU23DRAFT_491609 [Bimuria novae-zelandiae CBS 107.79]|uniref:Uncharacterized protein n=1 Tax=Bimuria novae-zelandiae CBS 107.79 TaxID=1447943 RepID=A0A6A5UJ37_9PLEO|nr:hypothetical protein BU23DRAFT_491609 [Bimuria novae-zelandiae CBS 107.79]
MAYLEISLTIARTLWYFNFKKAPGAAGKLGEGDPRKKDGRERVEEFQIYESLVVDNDGPNLVFTPRGEHWRSLRFSGPCTRLRYVGIFAVIFGLSIQLLFWIENIFALIVAQ